MGFFTKLANWFNKKKYVEPQRQPEPEASSAHIKLNPTKRKEGAYERGELKAGRITNTTYQRGRTRCRFSLRTRGVGIRLPSGWQSPHDIRCLQLMGMDADKLPALRAL